MKGAGAVVRGWVFFCVRAIFEIQIEILNLKRKKESQISDFKVRCK